MKRTLIAIAAIATLSVAGCSSSDEAPASDDTTAAAATTEAPPSSIAVEIGQPFEVTSPEGTLGTVTVLAVEPNPVCTAAYGAPLPPENGAFVAVQIRVETTPTHDETKFMRTTSRDFAEVTPAGLTKDVNTQDNCIADRDGFTKPFDPSSAYEGWVLLDVTDVASSLKYQPQYAPLGTPVWTIAIPAGAQPPVVEPAAPAVQAPAESAPSVEAPAADGPPNPYPNSQDSYGRDTGTSGATFVECADPNMYQQGTGVFSDGSMDYAPQCAG